MGTTEQNLGEKKGGRELPTGTIPAHVGVIFKLCRWIGVNAKQGFDTGWILLRV